MFVFPVTGGAGVEVGLGVLVGLGVEDGGTAVVGAIVGVTSQVTPGVSVSQIGPKVSCAKDTGWVKIAVIKKMLTNQRKLSNNKTFLS